jgi:hypothetical protein
LKIGVSLAFHLDTSLRSKYRQIPKPALAGLRGKGRHAPIALLNPFFFIQLPPFAL